MPNQPTSRDKRRVWELYQAGNPERVPVSLRTNDRVYVLDPRFNRDGIGYQDIFDHPSRMFETQLQWQKLLKSYYRQFCDYPAGIADEGWWQVQAFFHNVYEAWSLGCPVRFEAGQVPDTIPVYADNNKWAVFDIDIDHPLQQEPFRRGIEFTEKMMEMVQEYEFEGKPVKVLPYVHTVSDGPVTVALNLRGTDFLIDLIADPDYADQLMAFIVQAAVNRGKALLKYWGQEGLQSELWLADDSIMMISDDMYRERVLPHHRRFFESVDPKKTLKRVFHLCGDASRLFPVIVKGCGIGSIDTGFPVDFAWLREAVGPDVEIWGGVEVSLLVGGTPHQVATRTREILNSGVLEGKRFILTEANNLPPSVPEQNLQAMYQTALDYGRFEDMVQETG